MKRDDIVIVSIAGDYGKPRPAVVVQSDHLDGESVLVCLVTTTLRDAPHTRVRLDASDENGLRETSEIMVDKIFAVRRSKCSAPIGRLSAADVETLNTTLLIAPASPTEPRSDSVCRELSLSRQGGVRGLQSPERTITH